LPTLTPTPSPTQSPADDGKDKDDKKEKDKPQGFWDWLTGKLDEWWNKISGNKSEQESAS
jgi:hypothetical protein